MKEQKEVDIFKFKKGDIITRIKPIEDPEDGQKLYTFIGRKLIFMGIANATVYLAQEFDYLSKLFLGIDKNVIQLPIDLWSNGWAYHVDPDFLDKDAILIDDEEMMQDQLNFAVQSDNFEEAENLRKRLEELRKKDKENGSD